MTEKVAIVTDSICCFPGEILERYKITVVPVNILVGEKIYRDGIDLTADEAYRLFLKDPSVFRTSPAPAASYMDAFKEAGKLAENILCISLSSGISTAYNMSRVAREQAKTELPGLNIEVMDSRNVIGSEGFIALAAARAIAGGKGMKEAIATAEEVKAKATFFIVLETIKHVFRTGRIPKIASHVGSMLGVKPVLTISNGLVQFAGAVRNKKRGIERIFTLMREKVGNARVHAAVMHAYAREEGEAMKERVAGEFDCAELWLAELSPVVGYALGTGTVGCAFYWE
jgi:DegV family protein with EDD domain